MNSDYAIEDIYPLSPLQQGMMFHTLYAPDSRAYFHQYICTLRGDLDVPAFKKAWQRVIDRHTALRSAFEWEGLDEPVQVAHRGVELPIECLDWAPLTRKEQESRFESFLETSRKQGFDLSRTPLIRLTLIRMADGLYRFVWSHHHMILDGWSVSLVLQEALSFYEAYRENRELMVEASLPYREYISWLKRQDMRGAEEYWRQALKGVSKPTQMWVDRDAGGLPSQQDVYAQQHLSLSREATARLQSLAKKHHLTLNTIYQGAWGLLLSRYSGDKDVIFGVTIAGRPVNLRGAESMVGLFTNTLALRLHVNYDLSAMEWLKLLQRQQIDLQQYSYSPLTQVHEWSEIPRGVPLFESVLVFQNFPFDSVTENTVSGLKITNVVDYERNNLPLTVVGAPRREMLLGMLYDYCRYDHEIIRLMLQHLEAILEAISVAPDLRVGELPSIGRSERRNILGEWNRTESEYESRKCIHELIENHAEARPDAIALACEDQEVSYRELNNRANQLARYLRDLGVTPETRVGICLNRSAEMIEAALGSLKAGAAYVPLDPTYPLERLMYMLEDAQISTLISSQELAENLPVYMGQIISVDADREVISKYGVNNLRGLVTERNLAYVIYTSGSTGHPKGVGIEHRGLCNAAQAQANIFRLRPEDRVLQFASLSFDASIFEIILALTAGASLHVASREVLKSGKGLMDLIDERRITTAVLPPSLLGAIEGVGLPSLKTLIVAGEACPADVVERWGAGRHFINAYGPTEFTIWATAEICEGGGEKPSIGRPIQNTQVYILDEEMTPAPVGVAGELYLSGAGLARGYMNRADLTAERFVPNPFNSKAGERLYGTGDACRYLLDGRIDFIGRKDQQVKVRGYRIELGEVESALNGHPAVKKSVVRLQEDGHGYKRLVAYLVVESEHVLSTNELRDYLKGALPEYMAPANFVTLEAIPLLPNGKPDFKALPTLDLIESSLQEEYAPPTNRLEEALVRIWSEVLGVDRIGINDNFFVLGGDSIRGIQLVARAQENGFRFSLHDLFKYESVKALAGMIESAGAAPAGANNVQPFQLISEEDRRKLPDDIVDAYPLVMLQAGMVFHSEYSYDVYHSIVSLHLRLTVNLDALKWALKEVIARHPALRTSFNLTGFSQPLQLVHERAGVPLEIEDLRLLTSAEQERTIAQWIETEQRRPFNWVDYPLVRFQIHRRAEDIIQFTFCGPHALFDGWSDSIFLTELFNLYNSALNGVVDPIEPPPLVTFGDYVVLEQEALRSEECRGFWNQKLNDMEIAPLPSWPSHLDTANQPQAHELDVPISVELLSELQRLAELAGVSLKSVLLAAHLRVLSLLTGQDDVITGLVSHGRPEAAGGERIIGLFLNTLPLRLKLRGGAWVDLIRETFAAEAETMPFRRYPLAQIQRENGGHALFNTAFNFANFHVYQSVQGVKGAEVLGFTSYGKTNMTLFAEFELDSYSNRLGALITCDPAQISRDLLEAARNYYAKTLALMVKDPLARYEYASLLTPSEERALLVEWNETKSDYPQEKCLHELFEAQVQRAPDAVAVVFEDKRLTYAELNARADKVAHYLKRAGVETPIGICMRRSVEMVVGLLGVLKAGGAYVPIDPNYPAERQAFILEDAQAKVLLTQERLLERLPPHNSEVICLDAHWRMIGEKGEDYKSDTVSADNLSYIIYTSGSTGRPKGVAINHRSAVALISWAQGVFDQQELEGVLASTSICFDLSVFELFAPLSRGGKIILVENALHLPDLQDAEEVSLINTVPSAMAELVQSGKVPDSVRTVNLAGEPLHNTLAEQIYRKNSIRKVYNLYGPSEDTIYSTYALLEKGNKHVSIGGPISNTEVYILDRSLQLAPIGVPGELLIGGEGLARGYYGRADLTAASFIPNPFSQRGGERLYRSGDLARRSANGEIEFLGRLDHQVKIRGYRIELGEIEAALREREEVKEAAVIVRTDQGEEKRLVAYVVARDGKALEAEELRRYLLERLPDYMAPNIYVELEAMPLTPNGKLDRRALPAPKQSGLSVSEEYVSPRTPVEEILAAISAQVLEVDRVGVSDNFFQLGGHSLTAMQLASRLREAFQIGVPVRELFETSTVGELAKYVEDALRAGSGNAPPPLVAISRDERLPLSFMQQQLWFLDKLAPGAAAYNIPIAVKITGKLSIDILGRSLSEIVRRHEVLRSSFPEKNGQPWQRIRPAEAVLIDELDLSLSPEYEGEERARELAREEARRPFDLAEGPLLRVKLLKLDEETHVLVLALHHIVSDAWSTGILINELSALYTAFSEGDPAPFPELRIQYADYAFWQRQFLQESLLTKQLEYWRTRLGGKLPELKLAIDPPQLEVGNQRASYASMALSAELTEEIKALSRREGATLFMTLLAAFKALLYRYSGQEDIIVGTAIVNRNSTDLERLIGLFINTLPLRTDLSGDPTFRELLARVRLTALGAYMNQDVPFEKLVDELQPERALNRWPFFRASFVLQNAPMPVIQLRGLTLEQFVIEGTMAKNDLSLSMAETEQGLIGSLEYNADLFDDAAVKSMLARFQILFENIVKKPDQPLSSLRLLTDVESEGQGPLDFPDLQLSQMDFENILMEIGASSNMETA